MARKKKVPKQFRVGVNKKGADVYKETGEVTFGRKSRARALADHRANKALGDYSALAGQINFQDIDDPRIAKELAKRAAEDPRFKQNQLSALGGIKEYVDQRGIGAAEQAQIQQMNQQQNERLRGQRESTMQNMAMRGMSGGGQELAQQLAAQQGAAQAASMGQTQIQADAAGRRMKALGQMGTMSTGIRQQEFGMAESDRSANMNIAQFNSAQRMAQQQFNQQGQMAAIGQKAGIIGNVAQAKQAQASALHSRNQRKKDRQTQIGGQAIQSGGQVASSFSDIRVKENITPADIEGLLDEAKGFEYNYIWDGRETKRISPMAQNLLRSKLGREFVYEDNDGILVVDYGKALGTMMSVNANLHERLKKLEGK